MAVCTTCNGWGWVMRISANPPPNREDREKTLRLVMNNHKQVALLRQVCMICGGYGQRPDLR